MARIKAFLLELFSLLSRLINVLTGGGADMTFSARSHRDELWIEPVIDWIAHVFFRDPEHCKRWWLIEVERSQSNIEFHEKKQLKTRLRNQLDN